MSTSKQLKAIQVHPLPIGSGGKSPLKQQMNQTNTILTMLNAQANANTKYDPDVPPPVTVAVTIESFCSGPSMLMVIGGLLIVYSIVSK
jgi:hypothetical protein